MGIDFPSRDVRLALVEASQGRIGTPVDRLLLLCYHFDPATGCPYWMYRAKHQTFNPLTDVNSYDDLDKFGGFEDEWKSG